MSKREPTIREVVRSGRDLIINEDVIDEMEELVAGGNPIPWWIWLIIAGGIGLGIFQFYRMTEPVVASIQNVAPMIATAMAVLLNVLAFIPFFFIFSMVTSLLR